MCMASLLSKPKILEHYWNGTIVIHPFLESNVNTASVDVRLGENFFRSHPETLSAGVLNPFNEKSSRQYWGEAQKGIPLEETGFDAPSLIPLSSRDRVIVVQPGETVLAHTIEFIGGRSVVTTQLRAKSSMNRIGLMVSPSGGWGDIGFCNRWTLQLVNTLNVPLILAAGIRIAQIVFYEVDPVEEGTSYSSRGNYQNHDDVEKMVAEWKPEDMLPKLFKDNDIGNFHSFYT